jgi:hypothetical protein
MEFPHALRQNQRHHLRFRNAQRRIETEVERLNLQLNVLRISREEIGRQLDSALLRQELNQSQPVGEASQNSL